MAHRLSLAHHLTLDWRSLLESLFEPRRPKPTDKLDPRTLSDHLKRDLGILDGRDPTTPRR